MKRRDGLATLIRKVTDAVGTTEGDDTIRTFAIAVIESRDTASGAAFASGVDLALEDLTRRLDDVGRAHAGAAVAKKAPDPS